MADFLLLLRLRLRCAAGALRSHWDQGSRLKLVVVLAAAIGFWLGFYFFCLDGLRFVSRMLKAPGTEQLIFEAMLSLFFLVLLVMLLLSGAVVAFAAFFRSAETDYLAARPLAVSSLFVYKGLEAAAFSSWAFLFLGTPLIAAFGVHQEAPLYYYPLALAGFFPFILIPASLAGLAVIFIAVWAPASRKKIFLSLVLVILGLGVWAGLEAAPAGMTDFFAGVRQVLGRFSFAQNALLPSTWLTQSVLAAARGQFLGRNGWIFQLLLLTANALFWGWVGIGVAGRLWRRAYSRARTATGPARRYGGRRWAVLTGTVFFFLPRPERLIVEKDLKTFFRDPTQWSQFLIFFGILLTYILNLRNMNFQIRQEYWQHLIAFLNLAAVSFTLCTFTSRFVFPLISLEGAKFWILGLVPLSRRRILWAKFFFSLGGAVLVSESLVLLSGLMLSVPAAVILRQALTVFLICLGLSGLSVGLGVLFPNFKENNPSRIISGFGGTLNLVLGLAFVISVIAVQGVPAHLKYLMRGGLPDWLRGWFRVWLAASLPLGLLLTWVAVFVPMRLGERRFARQEF